VLAQALVGHHLELLLGVVSPGLSRGMAWGSLRAHMVAGGVEASAPLRLWVLLQQRWQVAVALSCPPAFACHLLQLVSSRGCWGKGRSQQVQGCLWVLAMCIAPGTTSDDHARRFLRFLSCSLHIYHSHRLPCCAARSPPPPPVGWQTCAAVWPPARLPCRSC
jgi:hypothetical protein